MSDFIPVTLPKVYVAVEIASWFGSAAAQTHYRRVCEQSARRGDASMRICA